MPALNAIAPLQLMRLVGTPDAPRIFDVRLAEDVAQDPFRLPASVALAHDAPLPDTPPDAQIVVICHRGRKLSEGVAALFRCAGRRAEILEGGFVAWRAQGLPVIPDAPAGARGLWVTRHRPKIDRIACPWLIRRFIDPAARFLFVAAPEVRDVADRFGAIPFDIPDVTFSHRGEGCTFDALLDDFGLHTEALDRLALVVRAADTDRHDIAPQAAGLLAVSVGLSRQFRDDLDQLQAGMTVYDALYRWARDGFDEGHDWPAGRQP